MTNREIIQHINALNEFTKDKLPVALSYAIAKNIRTMTEEYKVFDEERGKIMHEPDAESRIEELLNLQVDVPIRYVDYTEIADLDLSVGDILAIDFMVCEKAK